jgi:hypothetical protein
MKRSKWQEVKLFWRAVIIGSDPVTHQRHIFIKKPRTLKEWFIAA